MPPPGVRRPPPPEVPPGPGLVFLPVFRNLFDEQLPRRCLLSVRRRSARPEVDAIEAGDTLLYIRQVTD